MSSLNKNARPFSEEGFTLLELSLVLAIFIILIGFAMPRLSILVESDLEREANKMAKIISDLRVQAILLGNTYQIIIDTQKSEYTIMVESSDQPGNFELDDQFPKPIPLQAPISFKRVDFTDEEATTLRFAGRKIEFDKIFGQSYEFRIDYMGFVDLITVVFSDQTEELALSVVNIMGDIDIHDLHSATM